MAQAKPTILIDTDVVSYFLKQDSRAELFRPYLSNRIVAISFITLGELYFWAVKNAWGRARITGLENRVAHYLLLPYDRLISFQYARIRHQCQKAGTLLNHEDYWIAACAIRHDLPFLTNNVAHFRRVAGLKLIVPA